MTRKNRPLLIIAGMLGAGCTHVARLLSKRLGIEFINTEKILRRIVAEGKLTYAQLAELASSGEVDIEKLLLSELLDYVHERNVIIEGRSGLMVLDREADIKTFLWAPLDYRAKRVSERRKVPYEEAIEHVKISDEERRNLVRRFYKRDWMDIDLYDLVINVSKWTLEEVADLILRAYETRIKRSK